MASGKMKVPLLLLVTVLCLWAALISGCSASSTNMTGDYGKSAPGPSGEADRQGGEYRSAATDPEQDESASPRAGARYVIRTGSLALTVPDTRDAVEKVEQMTAADGGMVSESNIYEFHEGRYRAELTLRIPEIRFDSFIAGLQELGETSNIRKNSEDVTLPYLDLETRVTNLKAEEKRLREILAQAKTVEEILQVERELFRVRGEVEAMTAQFTHLQDQVALSTLVLTVNERAVGTGSLSQKPFENMGKRLKDALFGSVNFISSAAAFVLIALTTLLPALVIIALPLLLIFRLIRDRRRKKEAAPTGGRPPAMH